MSFSSDTKAELCREPLHKRCCAIAEAYGVMLYCNTFTAGEIRIVTGNTELAERLPKLIKKAFLKISQGILSFLKMKNTEKA